MSVSEDHMPMSVGGRCSLKWPAVVCGLVMTAALEAAAAPPVQTQQFVSSSGRTYIAYYDYGAGPCGGGAPPCDYRGVVHAKPGFEQAEVFLAGFRLETGVQADAVRQVSATAQRFRYDPATGDAEIGVGATLRTRSGQSFSYRVTFVLVLTAPGVAQFTTLSSGCAGVASCHVARTLPSAVPAGMQYIGLATSIWSFGSSAPILLNTLSGDAASLTVAPPSVSVDYLCELQGQRPKNRMFCEWAAKAIAFDPAEMTQNGSPIFPQYTFLSWNTAARASWVNQSSQPSHQPIKGFLDAFQGLTLTYQTFPPVAPAQSPVWSIESSAQGFKVDPVYPDVALSEYGIFLGTTFGNSTSAKTYAYQSSRAFGFLR